MSGPFLVWLTERLKAGFRYIKSHNLLREYQRIRQLCEIRQPSMAIRREPVRPPPTFGGLPARPVATPAAGWRTSTAPNAYTRPPITLQNWRATPCWKLVRALSPMELLTDITVQDTAQARREKRVSLALSAEDCALINKGYVCYWDSTDQTSSTAVLYLIAALSSARLGRLRAVCQPKAPPRRLPRHPRIRDQQSLFTIYATWSAQQAGQRTAI